MPILEEPRVDIANESQLTSHRMTDGLQRVVQYYDETAEDYLTWSRAGYMHFGLWRPWINPLNRRAMLEAMNRLVFQSLGLDNIERGEIADLGCGIGAVSHFGHTEFRRHRWHAFTICPKQVAIGRRRFGCEQVKFYCSDFADLPLADESLDAAFFLESLCHATQIDIVLQESARVLKPGGRLVIVDGMMRRAPDNRPSYLRRLAQAVERNWALGGFYSVGSLSRTAEQAGFNIQSTREMGWQVAPSVFHSPALIAFHTLRLIASGRWSRWKRRHMIGCVLGILLGLVRRHFGYYLFSLQKI